MDGNPDQQNKDEANAQAGGPSMDPAQTQPVEEGVRHDPSAETDNIDDTKAAPEVGEELSKVASSPKRNMLVFVAMAVGFAFMSWKLIGPLILGEDKPALITDTAPLPQGEEIEMPIEIEDTTPPIPQLPEPPQLVAPTPPPPPVIETPKAPPPPPIPVEVAPEPSAQPKPAALPTGVELGGTDAEDAEARMQAKRKSPIQLIGGAAGGGIDPETAAAANATEAEKSQKADFKKRGNLNYVLGKGKIIEVITETAINSDHPSEVRAIVTRDVYAESGKLILVPKGTRVFGEFTVSIEAGYGRVDIKWNRMDLATGYTITLDSPAVDSLGRSGVQAVVDNKYKEQMANAILSSAFSIGVAAAVDKLVPPVASTQTAANTQQANNLQSSALSIFNTLPANPGKEEYDAVREQICLSVTNAFPDKTSAAFATFSQACLNARTGSASPQDKLNTIMSAVTAAATGIVSSTAEATKPTKKQEAAEQAFKDLSEKMKTIVDQKELKPTTTVDQGTPVKIYIKKDYLFPRDAVARARVIR